MQRDVVGAGRAGGDPALFSNAYSIDLKSDSRVIIVAGQVGVDDQGQVVGRGDFAAQCHQVFGNLQKVLEAAGGTMANFVSLRTYLTRAEDWPRFHG